MNIKNICKSLFVGAMLLTTANAQAVTYGFGAITANDLNNVNVAESQLFVEVTEFDASTIQFYFTNVGTGASSITDIYFDDNASAIALPISIINGTGVDFAVGANPSDLPSGNTVGFVNDAGFDSDSNSPAPANGVNPGENLTIRFAYEGDTTFNDLITALNEGTLRIGIHVQAFGLPGSESLISSQIPEPSTYALLGSALGLVALAKRRRVQA